MRIICKRLLQDDVNASNHAGCIILKFSSTDSLKIWCIEIEICTLTILFIAAQALSPPPPSPSPPLITVFVLHSHSSSLHHGKEVKISHDKTSPPPYTFTPSLYSIPYPYLSPRFLPFPLTSDFLAPNLLTHFFFSRFLSSLPD